MAAIGHDGLLIPFVDAEPNASLFFLLSFHFSSLLMMSHVLPYLLPCPPPRLQSFLRKTLEHAKQAIHYHR